VSATWPFGERSTIIFVADSNALLRLDEQA
jgi:hypothetical protein